MRAFMRAMEERWSVTFRDFPAFRRWTVEEDEKFWLSLWDFCGVVAETRGERVVADKHRMPGARWFPDARLSFPENLLRRRDDTVAMIFRGEDRVRRQLTFNETYDLVSRTAQALAAAGVAKGDRVAGFMPNMPETVIAMLAATSLGAIWSSCSPDFGVKGLLDRFGQIAPKVLFAGDGYFYNGRWFDSLERAAALRQELGALELTVIVPVFARRAGARRPSRNGPVRGADRRPRSPRRRLRARELQRSPGHPLLVGHDGPAQVHRARARRVAPPEPEGAPPPLGRQAGRPALLLHDLRLDDVETGSWAALASEATLLLHDGSPFHPDGNAVFDYADAEKMTVLGTSAKYVDAVRNRELSPIDSHDLSSVKAILTTGSVLAPESFDFVYERIKKDVCLSSISGGTDIMGCFLGGNPAGPVWRGELQTRALGMAVDVFDAAGRPARGERGELVCTSSFPSMPVSFWNDPDGSRYREAYFEVYPGAWRHGDWCELTDHDGMIIHGRSDAVLNPGGVRIGTAEIYRQVEQLDEVEEGLAVGQEWRGDVRIVLFVRLREGLVLDDGLIGRIRARIRRNASPRHVPAKVLQVPDVPRTISGKITELAVREAIHGRPVRNTDAMANPEALDHYRDRPELAT